MPDSITQAEAHLRSAALELIKEPRYAALAAFGGDPALGSSLAADITREALGSARATLPKSSAHIAFEAVVVSNRGAVLDSIESSHGKAAREALESDAAALAKLPERSQCSISAWRFPDASLLFCSRCSDGSVDATAQAMLSCPGLLRAIQEPSRGSIARSAGAGLGADGTFPMSQQALEAMLGTMAADDGHWKPGLRVSERSGSAPITPSQAMATAKSVPNAAGSSLEKALAAALAEAKGAPKH